MTLLRRGEQERLLQLAKAQNVSPGEIIRRALRAYDADGGGQEGLAFLADAWSRSTERAIEAVDRTLRCVEDARQVVQTTLP